MTSEGDLLKLNLYLYILIYRNMKSIKDLGKLIEKWRQFYYFGYSEHLEILIALHIRLFLMSYDSGGMRLGDSEVNYDFFQENWFLIELLIWCLMYWIVFPIIKDALSANAMFH